MPVPPSKTRQDLEYAYYAAALGYDAVNGTGGTALATAPTSSSGTTTTTPATFSTGSAVTKVVPDGTSANTLLGGNSARKYAVIDNRAGVEVLIRLGSTLATLTTYSFHLAPNAIYEVPMGYTGSVTVIAASAGSAPGVLATELS